MNFTKGTYQSKKKVNNAKVLEIGRKSEERFHRAILEAESFLDFEGKKPLSVLIIDDDKYFNYFMKNTLNSLGHYQVKSYENEFRGLQEAIDHKIDLIFIDVNLKKSNGLKLGEAIRTLTGYEPAIIFVSADSSHESELQFIDLSINNISFISKPLSRSQIEDAIRQIFTTRRMKVA